MKTQAIHLIYFNLGLVVALLSLLFLHSGLDSDPTIELTHYFTFHWAMTELAEELLLLIGYVIAAKIVFLFSPSMGRALVRGVGKFFFWLAEV